MSSEITEVLKGGERNAKYGHVLSLQEKRNQLYPKYVAEAGTKSLKPITRELFYFLLGDATFVDLKEETCMCNQCKKNWWTAQCNISKPKANQWGILSRKMGEALGADLQLTGCVCVPPCCVPKMTREF